MRKNSPRKWLHAVLDLLPVILIPVFMIYSHRHEINDGSIQVQEKLAVDFNQLIENVNFANEDYSSPGAYGRVFVQNLPTCNENDIIYYRLSYKNTSTGYTFLTFGASNYQPQSYACPLSNTGDDFVYFEKRDTFNSIFESDKRAYIFYFNAQNDIDTYISDFNLFNLTQMFGRGNEPTIAEFKQLFPNVDYDYVLSKKMLVNKLSLTTYDDTDIMSQFTYQLYNAVDKYFNMGNVFNMNGVYDWFNLNIFNGRSPIYIYVVWQIVLYEFIMDLLFLLYGLFMWFIDVVQHLMDKPFKSIK